jgi:hypothetical protein
VARDIQQRRTYLLTVNHTFAVDGQTINDIWSQTP